MKKTYSVCLVFVLISIVAQAQFRYQRKIAEVPTAGWHAIALPESVLTKLDRSFSDIRIYSDDRTETPYLLRISRDEISKQEVTLDTYNVSRKGTDLFFTIKLANDISINHAVINLVEENFDTYVTIEGSNDEKEWFQIDTAQRIISMADKNIRYTSNTVFWSTSRFMFLRFKIANAKSLTLSSVNFSLTTRKSGNYKMSTRAVSTATKDKATEFVSTFISTQYISKLTIEAEPNQKFYRNYQVEMLTDSFKTEKGWQRNYATLQSGVITSLRQDTIQIEPTLLNNLRVIVFNEDNTPIKITAITTWSPEVSLITSLSKGNYVIKYSNPKIGAANYDLSHFVNEIPNELTSLIIGDEEILSTEEETTEEPWFKNKNWLWAIMLLVIGLLGFFTIRMLKKS